MVTAPEHMTSPPFEKGDSGAMSGHRPGAGRGEGVRSWHKRWLGWECRQYDTGRAAWKWAPPPAPVIQQALQVLPSRNLERLAIDGCRPPQAEVAQPMP